MGGMLKVGRALFFLGLVLAIVGFFRPWIPHASVALVVTGFELDEFAWLFPQVQSGAVALTRGLFLLPVTAAAVLLGLGIARLPVRWWVRLIPLGFAVTLALVPLPPYEVLQDPRYRLRMILAIIGPLLVLLTPLARRFPLGLWTSLVALAAVVGIVPAVIQYVRLRPAVVALYGTSFGPGWGLIACGAGFVLLLAASWLLNRDPTTK